MANLRLPFASALLSAVGVGAWWCTCSSAAPPVAAVANASAAVAPAEPVTVAGQPEATAQAADSRTVAVPPAATSPPPAGEQVWLRIVDDATVQAVPGAEVLWYSDTFPWATLSATERQLQDTDMEALLRQRGQRALTDACGRVAIPAAAWSVVLANSSSPGGLLHGQLRIPVTTVADPLAPFPGENVVWLRPDRTLLVRTVDAAGEIVPGVHVQLTRVRPAAAGSEREVTSDLPASGPDGMTRVPHVQQVMPAEVGFVAASLRAIVTAGNGEPVAFDPEQLPSEPIEVVVPDSGSVLVELLAADGSPWLQSETQPFSIHLHSAGWKGGLVRPLLTIVDCDARGQALFAHVCCGQRHGETIDLRVDPAALSPAAR
jgi:hypothetical protein